MPARLDENQKQCLFVETVLWAIAWPCTAHCSAAVPFNHLQSRDVCCWHEAVMQAGDSSLEQRARDSSHDLFRKNAGIVDNALGKWAQRLAITDDVDDCEALAFANTEFERWSG
jgi:hypothetical protein